MKNIIFLQKWCSNRKIRNVFLSGLEINFCFTTFQIYAENIYKLCGHPFLERQIYKYIILLPIKRHILYIVKFLQFLLSSIVSYFTCEAFSEFTYFCMAQVNTITCVITLTFQILIYYLSLDLILVSMHITLSSQGGGVV